MQTTTPNVTNVHTNTELNNHTHDNDIINTIRNENKFLQSLTDQDRLLPINNVSKLMKSVLPSTAKVSKEAKECVQECVSEFISFVTSEAGDRCMEDNRKTINGEDILISLHALGFENYAEVLKIYLAKYREYQLSRSQLTYNSGSNNNNNNNNDDENETLLYQKQNTQENIMVEKQDDDIPMDEESISSYAINDETIKSMTTRNYDTIQNANNHQMINSEIVIEMDDDEEGNVKREQEEAPPLE